MQKLCSFSYILLSALLALAASSSGASAQVLRNAQPYGSHTGLKVHQRRALKVRPLLKTLGSTATIAEYGTANLVADIGPSAEDKVRLDGQTQPLLIVLTNISAETTINFSSIISDTPTAFTVTTTCTSLQPGQSCNISATYLPQSLCDGGTANIIISDDDPDSDNNPYVEDPPGTITISLLGYGSDSGMTLDDLTDSKLSPTALAQALVGQGVTVSNVTYTGANRAAGTFSSTSNIVGFNSGIVLSTGGVRNVIGPNCDSGVTIENYYPGDSDLNTLLNEGSDTNNVTNDAAVLEFDFVPTSSTVSFQYVFSSDEYNEYVFDFNDVFGFFLNGNNIALIPNSTTPVSINTVNNGNSTGSPDNPPVNPQDFVNNDVQYVNGTAPLDTEMDGLTVVFSATATVTPNTTNHIKLAIGDAIDYDVDSNVFIKAGSFSSTDLTLTPTTQNFGSVAVGSSSEPVTFTLTNIGTAAIDLSNIATSAGFTETNNCGDGLNPAGNDGSSCTIQVSFSPTTSGAATGTLTVSYNAAGNENTLTITSSLTGTGTGAVGTITVAPTSLSFGTQVVSTTSAAQAITVTNTGTTSVTISSVTAPAGFAQTNNCTTLAASATCSINVTFTPTAAQTYTGNVTITDTASGSPQLVAVSGTGVTSQVIISIPSGGSNTATSVPGGTAYFGLILTPAPGFTGTVQLSCTTSSPTVTCTPIPSTITLTGNGSTEVAFGIQTYCKGTTTNTGSLPALPTIPRGPGGIAFAIVALALAGASWTHRRNPRAAIAFALVLIVILGGAACSGGPAKGPNGITPAGTYYITLTATTAGGTTTLSNYLTLVVN
jgi:hypothetical protein